MNEEWDEEVFIKFLNVVKEFKDYNETQIKFLRNTRTKWVVPKIIFTQKPVDRLGFVTIVKELTRVTTISINNKYIERIIAEYDEHLDSNLNLQTLVPGELKVFIPLLEKALEKKDNQLVINSTIPALKDLNLGLYLKTEKFILFKPNWQLVIDYLRINELKQYHTTSFWSTF